MEKLEVIIVGGILVVAKMEIGARGFDLLIDMTPEVLEVFLGNKSPHLVLRHGLIHLVRLCNKQMRLLISLWRTYICAL